MLLELLGFWSLYEDTIVVHCSAWTRKWSVDIFLDAEDNDVCKWSVQTMVCYAPMLQTLISLSLALPAIIYMAIVKPHDCF